MLATVCGMYYFSSHNHPREQSSNEMGQIDDSCVNEFVCFIKRTRHSLSVNSEIRSYYSSHCIQNFWHSDFGAYFCKDKQHFFAPLSVFEKENWDSLDELWLQIRLVKGVLST